MVEFLCAALSCAASSRTGPTNDVVLVHGRTQSAAGFDRLVDALERRGHRAVTVDVDGLLLPALAERLDPAHPVWLAAFVAGWSPPERGALSAPRRG